MCSSVTKVRCPQCGRQAEWSKDNPFRPFCSQRCKLIDLGAWADGSYRLPVDDSLTLPADLGDFPGDSDA